ncbi:winged helix-turn-helix domain-containing protein [Paraburkholderia sp. Ac-20347]|uniref:ATP-binding protein n=1 Tax=Paraburkholderia sp. Ac-20347 TaxID=2703892 RepID=UPI001980CDD1|nr:winged helix-turn-helix domain-containing protein [Paraburkholderia sp. Ac-20347]MBN3808626.1 transcriptional regulator [Paraburkholderia sp. Ac-20347]
MPSLSEPPSTTFQLGHSCVDLRERVLLRNGEPVQMGARAYAILEALIEADGGLVTKHELLARAWPGVVVEENNLQVQLSKLRRALGDDRACIVTESGRGYRLLAARANERSRSEVANGPRNAPCTEDYPTPPAARLPNLPPPIGRDHAISSALGALTCGRALTLIGSGGIGKTTLSMAVAQRFEAERNGHVMVIELAAMATADEVTRAVEGRLSAIGASGTSGTFGSLLLLDNAEHMIAAVADIVHRVLDDYPALHVLVTSREALAIDRETLMPVEPLAVPEREADEQTVRRQSAVQLFMKRVEATGRPLHGDAAEIGLIGEICRRLDGLPLAIELAAARVPTLGVEGVHRGLADQLTLLSRGFRTAMPRHRTLRATLDWSFALLDSRSRTLLRRLALFTSHFSIESLCAVACDATLPVSTVIDGIGELLAKSLVKVSFDGPIAHYRLSESTRAYALEHLLTAGEVKDVSARHARDLASRFRDQEAAGSGPALAGGDDPGHMLDDTRNAVDWAFSPDGDVRTGVELSSTLVSALLARAKLDECGRRAAQALQALQALPERAMTPIAAIRLKIALAAVLPNLEGPVERACELWREVHEHALQIDDDGLRARSYWGLWNAMLSSGKVSDARLYAEQFEQFARRKHCRWQHIFATTLAATAAHCAGDHHGAAATLEAVVQHVHAHPDDAAAIRQFAVDPLAICYAGLARIRWLEGDVGEAARLASRSLDLIPAETMEPWFTHVLGVVAAPLALISGDRERARHYLSIMQSQTTLHRLTIWREFGECLAAILLIHDGDVVRGLSRMERTLDSLLARGFRRLTSPLIVECAQALISVGRTTDALDRLHDAQAFCEINGSFYFMPEILRGQGLCAHAMSRMPDVDCPYDTRALTRAKACFAKAIAMARTQGARMWELRATLDLLELPLGNEEASEARSALLALANRFDVSSAVPEVRKMFALLASARPSPAFT